MRTNNSVNNKEELFVGLSSAIAIYKFDSYSSSAQSEELCKDIPLTYKAVSSLKEASEEALRFIKEHNLGSSNWMGGTVYDKRKNFVAWIGYNGRVWDNEDYQIAKEIIC
jgi:hypothetical protein